MKAKIYTKGGDKGETSLVGGSRVAKNHPRLNAYGTLDELNSVLGLIRAQTTTFSGSKFNDETCARIQRIQDNLFNLGSHLACESQSLSEKLPRWSETLLGELEKDLDQWEAELPPLRNFILPGGTVLAAQAHMARTICRRAERHLVHLDPEVQARTESLVFVNRLSDWLFVLARKFNASAGTRDIEWSKG
ncbi:MAG: cob(I)yrinic acid a,c-diamide adenosyltransferase [Bdellovibrionales bacterium]